MNPITLFELRQLVRNRTVLIAVGLYLTAMIIAIGFMLTVKQPTSLVFFGFGIGTAAKEFGHRAAVLLLLIYYVFTTLTLIGFGSVRIVADRLQENPIFQTTLPSWRFVLGKFWFGVITGLFFLSMTLPFLTVCYLMRGLDIRTLFFSVFLFFGMTQIQYLVAVAIYAGAKSVPRAVAWTFPFLFIEFFLSWFTILFIPNISLEYPHSPGLLLVALMCSIPMSILIGLSMLFALVQLSPETSNRMLPLRLGFTVVQILLAVGFLGGIMFFNTSFREFADFLFGINYVYWFFYPLVFLVFICERDHLTPRIRQTIPKTQFRRCLAFPFYTGAANAMVWAVLSLLFEGVILFVHQFLSKGFNVNWSGYWSSFAFGLIFFDYAATTLLLFPRRSFSRQWNWLPLFGLYAGIVLLAIFGRIILSMFGIPDHAWGLLATQYFLPFPRFGSTGVAWQLTIAAIWFIPLAIIGVAWIGKHWTAFNNDPLR